MPSRSLEDLLPGTREKVQCWLDDARTLGIPVFITCTYRSQEEQNALYEQGRTKPGPIVTWTRNSKHIQRRAIDFALNVKGHEWDTKLNVNENDMTDFKELGRLGEIHGLTWGGNWKNPDYPHLEDNEVYVGADGHELA